MPNPLHLLKGQAILALFNSSVKEALEKTFPELNIKRTPTSFFLVKRFHLILYV